MAAGDSEGPAAPGPGRVTGPGTRLLDTNVVIYSTQPAYAPIRAFVRTHGPAVSAITHVEALGFHRLLPADRLLLEAFFATAPLLPIDRPVLDRAVALRQQRRMSLGDAIIAGTALVHDLTLVTCNTADFRWIGGLRLLDPLAPPPPTPPPPPSPPSTP